MGALGRYHLEGILLESCSCRPPCPCWIGADPDDEVCEGFNAYSLRYGHINGVDVTGCNFVRVFQIHGNLRTPGSWREVLILEASASTDQAEAIHAAYTGACGGPLADLARLVGEHLGVERAEISYSVADGGGEVRAGTLVQVTLQPFVGSDGAVTTLRDSLMATVPRAPAYIARADRHRVSLGSYGLEWAFERRSAIHSEYSVSSDV